MNTRPSLIAIAFVSVCSALVCSASASVTVIDDIGRKIVLSHKPERIISLAPSVTEILYAVGAGTKLVADTTYCNYPKAALKLPHFNGLDPSLELMASLSPDLIVIEDQTCSVSKADQMTRTYGVPVYVTAPPNYQGAEKDIRNLGALVGDPVATSRVIMDMDRTLDNVQREVAHLGKPKVFVVIWDKPLMTAGRGTYIGNLIELAGGVNVAANSVSGYPDYSMERLASDNPDIILTGSREYATKRTRIDSLQSLSIRAVIDGKEYAVPEDWTVRPGPRLSLGLDDIAHTIHAELTNK